jgi:uncharacterized membrane protein YfcA
MTGFEYAIVLAIVFVGATVQASLGFGMNMVAMPLLVMIDTDLVPGPALVAAIVLTVGVYIRERRSIEASSVRWALVGRVIGTVVGVFALKQVNDDGLQVMVAVGVLVMALFTLSPWAPGRNTRTMTGAGVISGFSASTAGVGGPPVALGFQDAKGPTVRASMAGYFILGSVVTLAGLSFADKFGSQEMKLGLLLLPASIAGFFASGPLLPIVDKGYTRPALLGVSVLAAVIILARLTFG